MDIQTLRPAAQQDPSDPTRLKLERVPDPLNPRVTFDNTTTTPATKTLSTSVNFTRPEAWVALIKPAPGVLVPDNLEWEFFERDRKPGEPQYAGQKPHMELILTARNDPIMDYVAREYRDPEDPNRLTWFALSGWDHGEDEEGETEAILVTPMLVRAHVRERMSKKKKKAASTPDPNQTYLTQKVLLGQTFGTKKAQKAIKDREMNTLRSEPAKQSADGAPEELDDADKATLEEIRIITSAMATQQQKQTVVNAARPVPRANLEATEIVDVYDPADFVGAGPLKAVPILDWQEALQRQEGIESDSRFVARRLDRIGRQDQPADKLRLLRYLHFVILFYKATKASKNSRTVPRKDILMQKLSPAPDNLVENIRRKFSQDGVIDKFFAHMLITHCCTLAAIIDNFETDVEDLRDDLGIDERAIRQYYSEIGARVIRRKTEEHGKQVIAKLALPLQFPKQTRAGPPKRR
ncbi:A49-like RNA polymerase I associated factor-domain-containing protein [Plectosphaerella plurivora]|uniref:A49-like RNA polymerase I associated factor-domain-containing protein n=1 Tax=Plectosphaerella plurivora TaxID=936078 RepID=A0A9P9A5I0_9PEZI|nr:A49-like RNA polymerase I associated factor-domain-containing protein [Plectosphaerella plurivora]